MPKMKAKKAARKRFKIAGSGRVVRAKAGLRHKTGKRRPSRNSRLRRTGAVDATDLNAVQRALPYGK
jgi:large subunit ribosomal protein L35